MERYGRVAGIFENDKCFINKDNMKRILMVAYCVRRGKGPAAYVGDIISYLRQSDNNLFVDLFVTQLNSGYKESDFEANRLIIPMPNVLEKYILKIPKVREWCWNRILLMKYKKLIETGEYGIVVFHAIPKIISDYVNIAKEFNVKILLYPWGSEILRASNKSLNNYRYAFETADYIRGDSEMLCQKIKSVYSIPDKKFVHLCYGSKVISLISTLRNRYTKSDLAKIVGLREASYYITCGYNAYAGQQHERIVCEIIKVKDILPKGYEIVFPWSYGEGVDIKKIQSMCQSNGLNVEYLQDYLSDKQMACLHLLTDLFIHIQKTDLANSFIEEAIFAGTKVINGGWLSYKSLEDGGIPYYLTSSSDTLNYVIKGVVKGELGDCKVSEKVKSTIQKERWEEVIPNWIDFFKENL